MAGDGGSCCGAKPRHDVHDSGRELRLTWKQDNTIVRRDRQISFCPLGESLQRGLFTEKRQRTVTIQKLKISAQHVLYGTVLPPGHQVQIIFPVDNNPRQANHIRSGIFYRKTDPRSTQEERSERFKVYKTWINVPRCMLSLTSDLFDEGSKVEGREGGLLRWLDDHSVSTAQGRCDLPREHQQRKVPLAQTKEHVSLLP